VPAALRARLRRGSDDCNTTPETTTEVEGGCLRETGCGRADGQVALRNGDRTYFCARALVFPKYLFVTSIIIVIIRIIVIYVELSLCVCCAWRNMMCRFVNGLRVKDRVEFKCVVIGCHYL